MHFIFRWKVEFIFNRQGTKSLFVSNDNTFNLHFILLFNALQLSAVVERILQYLSTHSTNIWLIHLFLISSFAKTWSYAPQQPVLIYLWVLAWCLLLSHLINWIYLPLQRYVFTNWLRP